jgi:hypothetical protein
MAELALLIAALAFAGSRIAAGVAELLAYREYRRSYPAGYS